MSIPGLAAKASGLAGKGAGAMIDRAAPGVMDALKPSAINKVPLAQPDQIRTPMADPYGGGAMTGPADVTSGMVRPGAPEVDVRPRGMMDRAFSGGMDLSQRAAARRDGRPSMASQAAEQAAAAMFAAAQGKPYAPKPVRGQPLDEETLRLLFSRMR